ncbi:glycosyl hydrolase [Virgisporangium aliadipatigenens]|uniref:Glycosyl hydrolase n=1 Tax=Virgisporangium aliadipatigenens TaxID=741659 RepID=A0A8J4DQG6_9ACTN|nr:exo-alpha-sialidase [Virgisporangium aliadipatigenens]GIJ45688.1 glycosyl hydrolase [Virgisporangium aliadipatigenens]
MSVVLLIGTGKGLFVARSDDSRKTWDVSEALFPMTGVYAVGVDPRGERPRLLAGVSSSHFGPSVATSDDLGVTWQEPDGPALAFPADTDTSLERVWQLTPGPADRPGRVYAGVQPSALFVSDDGGSTFELVRGLWEHPHRKDWGAGFGGQAIHTILPDPADPDRVLVAMSTGGVYRTTDGGTTWAASNSGVKAYFLPDPWPEFGQCVHKVAGSPERLYLQNHHGVYRSDDGGAAWTSIADGLPSDFGFPIVVHPHRPDTVYVFPLKADAMRFPADGKCRVYRSDDAGATWTALADGLPDTPYYPAVLRDAMCTDTADPAGIYFGTRSGEVYASADDGDTWRQVAAHLPDVLCVRAVVA